MATINMPTMVMMAAAEAGKQQMQALIEKERNVDGFTDNADELAATNAFFDSLIVEAIVNDGTITFSVNEPDSEWGETIESGTDPVSGGDGGIVTYPDGHQEQSKVPPQLWGTALPWLKAAASTWQENVSIQAKTLIPEAIRETISEYSKEIGENVASELSRMLASALGGSSA